MPESHSSDHDGARHRGAESGGPATGRVARIWRVAVVGFEHMHAGDQISAVAAHPRTQLIGVHSQDPRRMDEVCTDLNVPAADRFTAIDDLVGRARPDIAVICSSTGEHRHFAEYFARRGIHVLLEKPFAANLSEAREMAVVAEANGVLLGVNWPLAWYPVHRTAQRLIAAGEIGKIIEIHYYDGNRGPLFHTHGKREVSPEVVAATKASTWWYRADQGGGSLRDYLGYGATLATWFRAGEMPSEISARVHRSPGDEVDEQSVVTASYPAGLSTFQTRWGTFTDPWLHQPYPRCGFVIVGTGGTIASFDYADAVSMQTNKHPEGTSVPVDVLHLRDTGGIANLVDALEQGTPLTGPISWQTSLAGQQIIEAAYASVQSGTAVSLESVTSPPLASARQQ